MAIISGKYIPKDISKIDSIDISMSLNLFDLKITIDGYEGLYVSLIEIAGSASRDTPSSGTGSGVALTYYLSKSSDELPDRYDTFPICDAYLNDFTMPTWLNPIDFGDSFTIPDDDLTAFLTLMEPKQVLKLIDIKLLDKKLSTIANAVRSRKADYVNEKFTLDEMPPIIKEPVDLNNLFEETTELALIVNNYSTPLDIDIDTNKYLAVKVKFNSLSIADGQYETPWIDLTNSLPNKSTEKTVVVGANGYATYLGIKVDADGNLQWKIGNKAFVLAEIATSIAIDSAVITFRYSSYIGD